VVTNFLGAGKMNMLGHDMSRVHVLNAGEALHLSDRVLHPIRPPYYDAPETHGFVDSATRVLFAADAFGALLPEPVDSVDGVNDGLCATGSSPGPRSTRRGFRSPTGTGSVPRSRPSTVSRRRRSCPGTCPSRDANPGRLVREVHAAWVAGRTPTIDPIAIETVTAALN
jgi:hypothetical protein